MPILTESFIEQCAHEYFNSQTISGTPIYQLYTFDQYVEMKRESERVNYDGIKI